MARRGGHGVCNLPSVKRTIFSHSPPSITVRTKVFSLIAACVLVLPSTAHARDVPVSKYTYVGSWHVSDGPEWTSDPLAMSGQMAAAFIFGGNPFDYVISTNGSNPDDINFLAFLDGWG